MEKRLPNIAGKAMDSHVVDNHTFALLRLFVLLLLSTLTSGPSSTPLCLSFLFLFHKNTRTSFLLNPQSKHPAAKISGFTEMNNNNSSWGLQTSINNDVDIGGGGVPKFKSFLPPQLQPTSLFSPTSSFLNSFCPSQFLDYPVLFSSNSSVIPSPTTGTFDWRNSMNLNKPNLSNSPPPPRFTVCHRHPGKPVNGFFTEVWMNPCDRHLGKPFFNEVWMRLLVD